MPEEIKSYKGQVGGYRPGSGRKKHTSTFIMERSRLFALQMIEKELVPIIQSSIDLAKGIMVMNEKGKVYKKEPDVQALKHIVDQIIGKAKESMAIEHSGSIGLADLLGKGALDHADEDDEK